MVVNGLRHPEPTIIIFAIHHNNILSIVELRRPTHTVRLCVRLCDKLIRLKNNSFEESEKLNEMLERSLFLIKNPKLENANWLTEKAIGISWFAYILILKYWR